MGSYALCASAVLTCSMDASSDLKSPLKQGEKLPVTLEFERAGKVKISLEVQGVGAQGPAADSDGKMQMKGMPEHSGKM